MQTTSQNGNAIIWIFIAVSLFAALSYSFVQSSRTSTSVITDALAQAYAQEIIAYSNEVKQAVKRLQLRGIDETEISFANDVWEITPGNFFHPAGHNANCTTNKCEIFNIEGGGIVPRLANKNALKSTGSSYGFSYIRVINVDNLGTSEPELLMTTFDINNDVCIAINKLANIGLGETLPATDSFVHEPYNGNFVAPMDPIGDVETAFSGKKSFCSAGGAVGKYHYHHVLIER